MAPRAAERALGEIAASLDDGVALIERSALPAEMKKDYAALIRARGAMLVS